MPSRNTVKIYDTNAYYHVYNRGVEKRKIFLEDEDYAVFLNLFKRYLDKEPVRDNKGREYEHMRGDIELIAFCLMPNHFHLLLFQLENPFAMTKLLHAVCAAYTVYFNKKYDRVGGLFQGPYKASLILNESYLLHISRYIHLNPKDYMNWEWSSLPYWVGEKTAEWVIPGRLNDMPKVEYLSFLQDYDDYKNSHSVAVAFLANFPGPRPGNE
jgi:putative transposase